MKETKVICSHCGAEVVIPNHEHTVKNATVIGKDSGLGTVYLSVAKSEEKLEVTPKTNKAEDRLAALKAAGVDTSNLFAMRSASGEGMIVRLENGVPTVVAEDDPVFLLIENNGTIPNCKLFRRHITAQTLRMLSERDWRTKQRKGFTQALHDLGYEYSWKMFVEELRVQAILFSKDKENFYLRNRWFNTTVAELMAKDYIHELEAHIKSLPEKHCKGIPYKRIAGRNIFESDIRSKIVWPLESASHSIKHAKNPDELYKAVRNFDHLRIRLPWETKQSPAWVDAYKGCGAYFTMKNLIMFSGLKIKAGGVTYNKAASLDILERRAVDYTGEGWRLHAMMKKFLDDNNLDPEKKLAEWRRNK